MALLRLEETAMNKKVIIGAAVIILCAVAVALGVKLYRENTEDKRAANQIISFANEVYGGGFSVVSVNEYNNVYDFILQSDADDMQLWASAEGGANSFSVICSSYPDKMGEIKIPTDRKKRDAQVQALSKIKQKVRSDQIVVTDERVEGSHYFLTAKDIYNNTYLAKINMEKRDELGLFTEINVD